MKNDRKNRPHDSHEFNAVNFENFIRKEEGRPQRKTYGGIPIPQLLKDYMPLWRKKFNY